MKKSGLFAFLFVLFSLVMATNVSGQAASNQLLDPNQTVANRYMLFNVNENLPRYKVGQKVMFIGDGDSNFFKHFPSHETAVYGKANQNAFMGLVQIKATKIASWQMRYYFVKEIGGKHRKGWVGSCNIAPANIKRYQNKRFSTKELVTATTFYGLNYINYVRYRHHLQPLSWSIQLAQLAQYRTVNQLPNHFSHYDDSGVAYSVIAANALGFPHYVSNTDENIARMIPFPSANQNIINDINAMMYEDGSSSHWEHRWNFLDSRMNQIGIGISQNHGNVYIAYELREG